MIIKNNFRLHNNRNSLVFQNSATYVRNIRTCEFVVLPFVQLLAQALRQMHYKAGGCFQIVAAEAELLFSQLLEFVAQSEILMPLAAESIVYEERGYCCDPYFVHGPETKPNHKRYRAPSAGVLLLVFKVGFTISIQPRGSPRKKHPCSSPVCPQGFRCKSTKPH